MIIGITGSLGSGKTTVSKMFSHLGAYVIDADEICHGLLMPSKDAYRTLVRSFGASILKRNRRIDRKKLGELVFKKKSNLKLLNRIVHPEAIKEIDKEIRKNRKKTIVIDAPLLVESGLYKKLDKIVVLKNTLDIQVERVARSGPLGKKEALRRIRMQAPLKRKLALADFIIDNSGSRRKTLFQVRKIWKKLRGDVCL